MRRSKVLLVLATAASAAVPLPAGATHAWTFTPDGGVRVPTGVSPEVRLLDDGSVRLYVTGGDADGGIGVFRADDGLDFEQEADDAPSGSDPTIVTLDDGTLRMYYIFTPPGGGKQLLSAVSDDGLTWEEEAGVRLANAGLGVPDVVPLPGGRWRVYFVADPSRGGLCHCIVSAVSSDGLTFVMEDGRRMPRDFVDPEVVQLTGGGWLMAAAKFEFDGVGNPRSFFLATSANGLKWEVRSAPFLDADPDRVVDPVLLAVDEGYRVYYGFADGSAPDDFQIRSGVLVHEEDTYQPDGAIKRKGTKGYAGSNVYNTTGRKQTARATVPPGDGVTLLLRFQNDGTAMDTFTLDGCDGDATFSVTYLKGARGDTDITTAVVTGTHELGPLPAGGKGTIRLQVDVEDGASGGVRLSCRVEATSQTDASAQDAVRARVTGG